MKPWTLGLTGGIGSGKSAVAAQFAALGVDVVDADQAARWVVEPGRPALTAIAKHFGEQVLQADGQLNRSALRELIFQSPAERSWLERLLHPLIAAETAQFLANAKPPYAIMVSPLLIESGQYKLTQRILVVDVPEKLQIERTMQRDRLSAEQVRAIMAAQTSRETRLSHANDILVNDRDLAWVEQEVERLHAFYLTLNGGQP